MIYKHALLLLLFSFSYSFTASPAEQPKNKKAVSSERFSQSSGRLSFSDISFSWGVADPNNPNPGGGHTVQFYDVNGDGRPDLYITMLLEPGPLDDLFFLNVDNLAFSEEAVARGIADFDGGSHGAAFADLDNDGDYDLANGATLGSGQISAMLNLYRNNSAGFFEDVTIQSGIPQRDWPTRGVVVFDMDGDGDLDIFCVTNFEGSADPPGERNEVYRNDGQFRFTSINSGDLYTAPAAQGATDTDFDNDGDIDIIAGNRTGDLNVLVNDGFGNFTLTSPSVIGIQHRGREGVTMADINNDAALDMILSDWDFNLNHAVQHLYINDGSGSFIFDTTFSNTVGFMAGVADLDNDTDLDLVFSGKDTSYLNDGRGKFTAGPTIPVPGIKSARAVAFSDIDNDGDVDFAIAAKRSRNWLFRNNFNSGNWLKVKLISRLGQAGAFGAKVAVYPVGSPGNKPIGFREARSNNGYLAQDDPVLHFGLGESDSVDLVVTFLDQTIVRLLSIEANQTVTVNASESDAKEPVINSFTPQEGKVGDRIRIDGKNFQSTSVVEFNSVQTTVFTVFDDSQLDVTVPENATSGPVKVHNIHGVGTSTTPFLVIHPPHIDSFTPSTATIGMEVTIRGEHLDRANTVLFNVIASDSFIIDSAAKLRAIVPGQASSGPITISNSAGLSTSSEVFEIVPETLSLLRPNGGEVLFTGETYDILWQHLGIFKTVDIELSVDNGINWDIIGENLINSDSLAWQIPDVLSDRCLIRIREMSDGFPSDTSDAIFSIREPLPSDIGSDDNLRDFHLFPNYPNPFNGETVFLYTLPRSIHVKIVVYNILGEEIRMLVDEKKQSGQYTISWDGRDETGRFVSSGVYLYRMITTGSNTIRKLLLLK